MTYRFLLVMLLGVLFGFCVLTAVTQQAMLGFQADLSFFRLFKR